MATNQDELLFKKHYKSLCYFAYRMVQDERMAEDLVQDAFVNYLNHKKSVAEDENAVKGFLYSSVKYAVYNLNRRSKVVQKFWDRAGFTERDTIDHEHDIIRAEFVLAIQQVMDSLPEACRKVMTMSYIEGYANDEIAKELQLSINTVKTQKRRGLNVFREKLNVDYFVLFMFVFGALSGL